MSTDRSIDDLFLPLAFSLFSNPGAYAVLAGAGVSRGAGLPTAWDIVVDLIDQMAQGDGGGTEITPDTAEPWYEKKFGRPPTYSDVVEQLALTPTERQGLLRRYFEPPDADDEAPFAPGLAFAATVFLADLALFPPAAPAVLGSDFFIRTSCLLLAPCRER